MRDKYTLYPCRYYRYFSDYSIHECLNPNDDIRKSNSFVCKDPKNCPYRNDEFELVNCPFCKTEQNKSSYKKSKSGYYIECIHCHSRIPEFKLKIDAIKFWNNSKYIRGNL